MRRGPVRVVMGALLVAMFLASVDQTIVATGLPTIVGEFQRADRYAWVITTYLLAETAFTPIFGKAGDLYGRKRVLQVAIVVFLAGSCCARLLIRCGSWWPSGPCRVPGPAGSSRPPWEWWRISSHPGSGDATRAHT